MDTYNKPVISFEIKTKQEESMMSEQEQIAASKTTNNGASIHTIKIWFKAFIPNTYAEVDHVPGNGEHAGKTMLSTLGMVNRCFLTDQRAFSPDVHAEARMHSELEIDVAKRKSVYEFHHCYETIEVDCRTGEEKCRKRGDTTNMKFENFTASEDGLTYTVDLTCSSKNPCVTVATVQVSPNVDYYGSIRVTLAEDRCSATVGFEGMVEAYPAFEMYVGLNGSDIGQPVLQIDVQPDATVKDITGAPTRQVSNAVIVQI